MLYRRSFLAGTFAIVSGAASAQDRRRRPKIGVLWHAASVEEEGKYYAALSDALRAAGYENGKTADIEHRFPAEQKEKFERFAEELVALKVDVLIAVTLQAALAAKRATNSTPIVFLVVPDPVSAGLVESLAAPGGNITGYTNIATDLTAKRLQLFREALGGLSRVGLLVNPTDPVTTRSSIEDLRAAGEKLEVAIVPFEARARSDLAPTMAKIAASGVGGFVVAQHPVFFNERRYIAESAIEHGLPSISINSDMVEAGMLMSYGANHEAIFRQAPAHVQRILRGVRPAQLPVEQPTKLELAINLKTAAQLGLTIAPSVLAQADRIIDA